MGEKDERPERVFPGRTDPWFIAAMVIVAGGLSAACIACFLSSSPALLWGWFALLPVPALVAELERRCGLRPGCEQGN